MFLKDLRLVGWFVNHLEPEYSTVELIFPKDWPTWLFVHNVYWLKDKIIKMQI